MHKAVANRVRRVVRGGEGVHAELLEIKFAIRFKHADVLRGDFSDASRHIFPALRSGIDGDIIFTRQYANSADMVGMLMRHQNRIQPFRGNVDHGHEFAQTFGGHARVNEQANAASLEIGCVAGRTAAQR